jgi:predicted PurR-regulated permease PerM
VGWLKSRRVPTILAVLMVIILLVGTLSGVGALVGGSVNEFIAAIPTYQVKLNQFMASSDAWLERFDVDLPSVEIMDYVNPGALMNALGAGLRGLAATLSNTFLILLTMAFVLLEASTVPVKMQAAFGDRPDLSENLSQITLQVQRYLAMKTLISLVTAVCVTVWTSILGLDFAFVWGLLAFLLNYIPSIGSIIAAVPAVLFTLVQYGVGTAVLVAIGYVVINVVLGNIVEPNVMGRTLGLSTLVVFRSLVFWGWVWGPMGMLLSVPLTMIVKIFLENSDDLRWMAVLLDSGRAAQARLEAQVPTDGDD